MLNCLPKLENHANKRVEKKTLKEEMQQRVESGLKPHAVR